MRQFIKNTFSSAIGSLIGLTLFFSLGATALVLMLLSLSVKTPTSVKDKSILVFDLSVKIDDTKPATTLSQAIQEDKETIIPLRSVLDSIDKASKDSRIVGIFLDGRNGNINSGYANLQEIRSALQRFHNSGKKIIAYNVDWNERDYYLGSIADKVIINPLGGMEINGFNIEQVFWGSALQKYGVGVQVIRVGKYKSAIEIFSRDKMSPENREQNQVLLNNLWQEFVDRVSKSRNLSSQKIQDIVNNQGLLTPEESKTLGLVDRVGYFDEAVDELQILTESKKDSKKDDDNFPKIKLANYIEVPVTNVSKQSSSNKIAVVYAYGEIVDGQGGINEIGGDSFAEQLKQLRQDDYIKAIVLRINSPGGSATASEIILREIQLLQAKKPTIVSMGNVAASGGYWIATGSDYIFAQENTITGSIGVFGLLFNFKEIANKNGINWDTVKTGNFADLASNSRPKTPAEIKIYEKSVDRIYDFFLDKVSKSRKLSKQQVNKIAQGRVWSGKNAKEVGLVDSLGGLEDAIKYAANKANLGDDWEVEEYPAEKSLEQEILSNFLTIKTKQNDPLIAEFLKIRAELDFFQKLKDPKGIYARLPLNFTIE
jgi:protease-4